MRFEIKPRFWLATFALGACMGISLPGCSSNPNEAENARTMAPGIPSDHPNESFADRRARTRTLSKQSQQIQERNESVGKKAAEKAAEKGAKASTP